MWACDPAITTPILDSYKVAGPLFVQTLQSLLAAQCALAGDHLWPPDATEAVVTDPNYDFIIVGAGSAGAVVANRLSEIPHWKILLVEAGGNPNMGTEIPQLFYNNLNTSHDWGYRTEPQKYACRGYKENRCAWPRGKCLGGTSSVNGMFYVRGNKLDYDEWAANGNEGWDYENVLHYFKKSENYSGILTEENKKFHSHGGYLHVLKDASSTEIEQIIINAIKEQGIKELDDINGPSQMGVTRSLTTIKDGVRQSTARAFLSPIKERSNLHVIRDAFVTKILFKQNTNAVKGIILHKNGKDIEVKANKEVILSAGTVNTPQLLMLSGIGPQKHLESLNIEIKANLPVGKNLEDHVFFPIYYIKSGDENVTSLNNIVEFFMNYLLTREGQYSTTNPHKVISFLNSTNINGSSPDVQFHYLALPPKLSNLIDVYATHNFDTEVYEGFQDLNKNNFVLSIYNVLLKPKSKGQILLNSIDPFDYPLIQPNYFQNPDDLKTLIKAVKGLSLKLGETKAFKDAGFKLAWMNIDACKTFDSHSEEFLECIAKELTFSLYHPTGTVKMGPHHDETAVVDPELKVKNVHGLRVIDASIMPNIVRGNTNAPTIMIAEKGADLIKNFWINNHSEL